MVSTLRNYLIATLVFGALVYGALTPAVHADAGPEPGSPEWNRLQCTSNLKNLGTALEMYATDNRGLYPPTGQLQLLTPNYLKVIPTCPAAGTDTYSATYQSATKPNAYTFCCGGSNHAAVGVKPDFPQYNSNKGLVQGWTAAEEPRRAAEETENAADLRQITAEETRRTLEMNQLIDKHIWEFARITAERLTSPAVGKVFAVPIYKVTLNGATNTIRGRLGDRLVNIGPTKPARTPQPDTEQLPDFPNLLNPNFRLQSDSDGTLLQSALDTVDPIIGDHSMERFKHLGNSWTFVRGWDSSDKEKLHGYILQTDASGRIVSANYSLDIK